MSNSTDEMKEEELRLDKYFAAVWRAKWVILFLVLLAAGASAVMALNRPALHEATALIEIGRVWKEPLEDPYLTTQIVNSPGFIQELSTKIGAKPNRLKNSVRAEAVIAGSGNLRHAILVRITATSDSADQSEQTAQSVANELIARHEKLFNDSIAPYLDRQRRIEERIKEMTAQPSAPRDILIKLESELDEVKSANSSPIITEKTRLIGPVVSSAVARPAMWRSIAVACAIAAVIGIAAAALAAHFRTAGRQAIAARK